MTRVLAVTKARNIAYLAAFFGGSLGFVLAALAMSPFGQRPFQRIVESWSRYHRSCLAVLIGIRVAISGTPPLPGTLVAMKHESMFEAIDLPALLGNPAIFAKAELLRIPLWGRVAARYGLIPIERDQGASALRKMLSAARAHARDGRRVAIFPEGTRVPHGTAPPLMSGFAGIYKVLGVAVVPIAVDSGRLSAGRWKLPGTIHVAFGEPIPPGLPRDEIEARVHGAINALNEPWGRSL